MSSLNHFIISLKNILMKRLLFISSMFGLIAMPMMSEDIIPRLELVMHDNVSNYYILDDSAKMRILSDKLVVSSADIQDTISIDNVKYYRFTHSLGIITLNDDNDKLNIKGDDLIAYTTVANSILKIANISGEVVISKNIAEGIDNVISLRHLPHGIYIVSFRKSTIKIVL